MNRIIQALVALVLATSGLLVAGSTGADAVSHPTTTATTVARVAPTAHKAATAARSITLKFTKKAGSHTKFHVKAGISPDFRNRVAKLQYMRHRHGTFHKIKKARSNAAGIVRFGIVSKLGYYRVVTKADALYVRSGSNIILVYPKS